MRPTPVLALVLSLAAAPAALAQEARAAGSGGERPRADYGWELRALDGRVLSLEAYRGRPLVLNLWATWCPPCVAELASLERLHRSMAGTDAAVLIVSPEPVDRVRAFLRRHEYDLPAAIEAQRMPASWELEALPTTWILDRDGGVVLKHRGAADWDRPEIRKLLHHLVGDRQGRDHQRE